MLYRSIAACRAVAGISAYFSRAEDSAGDAWKALLTVTNQ